MKFNNLTPIRFPTTPVGPFFNANRPEDLEVTAPLRANSSEMP